jgi:hypothetical protein
VNWRPRRILAALVGTATAGLLLSSPSLPRRAEPAHEQATVAHDEAPTMKATQTPNDAVRLALADVQTLAPGVRCNIRYLWIQDGAKASLRTSSLALNYLSRASAIFKPLPVAEGHLVRVDLRTYAPRDRDLREWFDFWEQLQFDPMFSLLLTRDTIAFAGKLLDNLPKRKVTRTRKVTKPGPVRRETRIIVHAGGPYAAPDDSGRSWPDMAPGRYEIDLEWKGPPVEEDITETVEETAVLGEGVDVLRLNAAHIDPVAFVQLQELTHTLAPVVEHRYFKSRALRTIKDQGVFRTIFGGLYYELRGIRKAKDVLGADTKATDLDLFFEGLGIGSIKAGLSAEQLFDKLRSDQRLAVFRSGVTGKPREVDMFHTPAAKEGNSWGAITGDVKDRDVDLGDRAFANLLNPRRQAREAIFPAATDLPEFALFNGQGALQDEVPPDVANDSTVPRPHTQRLEAAIGCLRCHYLDGSDGWKPLVNDVKRLLDGRLDLFGDLSQGKNTFAADTIDRLAGLFGGDFSKNLRRNRDDIAEATLRATGPWDDGGDQTTIAKLAGQRLAEEFESYVYDLVDCQTALREIGLQVDRKRAVETFRALVPPDLRSTFAGAYVPEDPRIGALRAGLSINRTDWALVYNFAAERAQKNLAASKK